MPLDVDYMPESLDEFEGNQAAKKSLGSVINRNFDNKQRTFLFTGPSGCGKTSLAWIIKCHYGISDIDYYYYNSANTRGIDTIRHIANEINYAPSSGKMKMYTMDEVHGLTGPAQEALLEMMRKPPKHVVFAFCTTEPEKLKVTFKRRCHCMSVMPLRSSEAMKLMEEVIDSESEDSPNVKDFPKNALKKIIRLANGSPGICLGYLDQVLELKNEDEIIEALEEITYRETEVKDMCYILNDARLSDKARWDKLKSMLKDFRGDPEQARRAVLGWFNTIWLSDSGNSQHFNIITSFMTNEVMYSGVPALCACFYLALGGDDIPF